MKIIKLTSSIVSKVIASTVKNKNKTKEYYNIKHGGRGEGLHTYKMGMDERIFKVDKSELILNDDNYILIPIYRQKKQLKDKADNFMYYISTDQMEDHKNDHIVFWEIPNKFYTDVKYEITGDVNTIACGTIGRSRGNVNYTSPAPILEVYGECTLSWTAIDNNGRKLEQVFTFEDGKWNIGTVNITEIEKEE